MICRKKRRKTAGKNKMKKETKKYGVSKENIAVIMENLQKKIKRKCGKCIGMINGKFIYSKMKPQIIHTREYGKNGFSLMIWLI